VPVLRPYFSWCRGRGCRSRTAGTRGPKVPAMNRMSPASLPNRSSTVGMVLSSFDAGQFVVDVAADHVAAERHDEARVVHLPGSDDLEQMNCGRCQPVHALAGDRHAVAVDPVDLPGVHDLAPMQVRQEPAWARPAPTRVPSGTVTAARDLGALGAFLEADDFAPCIVSASSACSLACASSVCARFKCCLTCAMLFGSSTPDDGQFSSGESV